MSNSIMHRDGNIFPDSHAFNPERWLNNPRVTIPSYKSSVSSKKDIEEQTSKPLSHYMVAFSRGPRNCIGQNLAWAELYIGLATVFRRVKMELFETGPEAVEMAREYIVPLPKEGTLGVRVKILDE